MYELPELFQEVALIGSNHLSGFRFQNELRILKHKKYGNSVT